MELMKTSQKHQATAEDTYNQKQAKELRAQMGELSCSETGDQHNGTSFNPNDTPGILLDRSTEEEMRNVNRQDLGAIPKKNVLSSVGSQDIPEAKGSKKKPVTCKRITLLIFFITQLGTIAAVVYLLSQLSRQLEVNIKLKESEDNITAMGRTQKSIQMLLEQAEEKLTVMTKNQSDLQIQLKQAKVDINTVKTKQSSLETKVSQAEQKITALERNLSQIGLQGKCCPPGWDSLSPSCYYFATSAENWHSAQTRCKNVSSDLVVIKSAEEQEFIKQRKRQDWIYWIGLTDTEVERTWKWVDGSFCSSHSDGTVYWYESQPDDQTFDEDCAVIYTDGSWHDFSCNEERAWICEKPAYTYFS